MVSIDVDASLLFQIVNFLVLMAVLNVVLYKPIRGILKERAARIAQLNGEAAAATEGVASRTKALDDQRVASRKEGAQLKEALKGEGHSAERAMVQEATAEMEAAVVKVRAEVKAEIDQAKVDLQAQVQGFGVELAQKILGRSIQ
jgi:F-type H+-transporting ATPase subunit b